jgi:Protein of unknown function (DUF2523)
VAEGACHLPRKRPSQTICKVTVILIGKCHHSLAINVAPSELATDQPRPSVIRLAGRAIRDALAWLSEQVRWLVALGVGGVVYGVSKKLGEDHAEQILTQLIDLEAKLTAIMTPIAHLFTSMQLPF